jgi:hypothetical protein
MHMKLKSFLIITITISVCVGLLSGCSSPKSNDDKRTYTKEEISYIKNDLLEKFSKSITDSGFSIVESDSDNRFVLSLGNLEKSKEQPKQVFNYSMTLDDNREKEVLDIQCVKEYSQTDKLVYGDKFVKAIYNIYKSLTDTELTEKVFFNEIEKEFNNETFNLETINKHNINIQVNKIKNSTKSLELRFNKEFIFE